MSLKDMMALTVAIGVLALGSQLQAQSACAEREQVVARLDQIYGETPRSVGLAANGQVIEVFASEAGTWTIIMTNAAGISCLAAAGDAWQQMPESQPGEKA